RSTPPVYGRDLLPATVALFRSQSPGVIRRDFLRNQRRETGYGLRGPGLLARHAALRNGTLLNRVERFAVLAIQHENVAHLGCDRHRRPVVKLDQGRLRGHVIVPEIVMHYLKAPDNLAGCSAQSDHGISMRVVARPRAAVELGP